MPTMTDEELYKVQRKLRDGMLRLTRWKLRDMRRNWTRPRAKRLPKDARALKSLLRQAKSAGLWAPNTPTRRAETIRTLAGGRRTTRAE